MLSLNLTFLFFYFSLVFSNLLTYYCITDDLKILYNTIHNVLLIERFVLVKMDNG